MAPETQPNDGKALALAAYRDLSAGREPSVALDSLPIGDVVWAALAHGNELYAKGLKPRSHEGLADSIALATRIREREEG